MARSGIYTIRHRATGKAYVGRSVDIDARWHQHRYDARKRAANPLHRALAKYGPDAFDWEIIILAPVEDLPWLEAQFIASRGTMKPFGFNIGGTLGGLPSLAEMELMPPEARARWESLYREGGRKARASIEARRADPAYEAQLKASLSAAAKAREARLDEDPEKRAAIKARRSVGIEAARKAVDAEARARGRATFAHKMATDPEFAARVRANRARAARAAHV